MDVRERFAKVDFYVRLSHVSTHPIFHLSLQIVHRPLYPLVKQYIDGTINETELERKLCVLDWRLAKRQLTWLRRNKDIKWFSIDEAWTYIVNNLDKSS